MGELELQEQEHSWHSWDATCDEILKNCEVKNEMLLFFGEIQGNSPSILYLTGHFSNLLRISSKIYSLVRHYIDAVSSLGFYYLSSVSGRTLHFLPLFLTFQ
jgi:hypothetical protein